MRKVRRERKGMEDDKFLYFLKTINAPKTVQTAPAIKNVIVSFVDAPLKVLAILLPKAP